MKDFVNELKRNNIKKFIEVVVPFLIVAVCYYLSIKYSNMFYLTNDDVAIQSTLSGNVTGEPYPIHPFVNVLLSCPISWMYRMFPKVQWWYLWSHLLIITGMLLINYSIMVIAKKCKFSSGFAIAIIAMVNIVFMLYPIANVSFTIVPGILGAGIVSLLFTSLKVKNNIIIYFISFTLYILVLCHRQATGMVILCFILLVLMSAFISNKNSWKKDILKYCLVALGLLCLTLCITKLNINIQEYVNGSEFRTYNSARSAYVDFPHDTFDENPEIYEHVGWDDKVYKLVSNWCFMDERVDAESFRYLAEHSNKSQKETNRQLLWESIMNDPATVPIATIWKIVIIITLCFLILGFDFKNLLIYLLNILGTGMLILYQLYLGRILYRTLIIVFLPSLLINIILIIKCSANIKVKKIQNILIIILLILSLGSIKKTIDYTFDQVRAEEVYTQVEKDIALLDYAVKNNNNIYIKQIGVTNSLSPYALYVDVKPYNVISWGGSEFNSKSFQMRLEKNGLEKLTGDVFKHNNVFFVSNTNLIDESYVVDENSVFVIFFQWMKNNYNAIGIKQVDKVCDGVYVYRFVFEDSSYDLENYFDYVGETLVEHKR